MHTNDGSAHSAEPFAVFSSEPAEAVRTVPEDAEWLAHSAEDRAYHEVALVSGNGSVFRDPAVGVLPVLPLHESAVLQEPKKAPQRSAWSHLVCSLLDPEETIRAFCQGVNFRLLFAHLPVYSCEL